MKNKFVTSTLILVVGGLITKILAMLIRIIMTRMVGTEGIGLYMLVNPTFLLFIAIAVLGMPTAISKLVAENKRNNRNVISSAVQMTLLINIIMMFVILFSARFISNNLLQEPRVYYSIIMMAFVLPFISITSILRGYFFGKQKMLPHVVSNIIEDIVRLIAVIIFVPIFLTKGLEFAVAFLIGTCIIGEIASTLVLVLFLPKKFKLKKEDIKADTNNMKGIMNISIPATGSRLIGSIGLFFEPIIITFILLKIGYDNNFIITEYGILNGYVMPLILLPSFFTGAISQALLPVVSSGYSRGNINYSKKKIKQAIIFSLLIGIPATLIFVFIPQIPLNFIYNTNEGINYIRVLAPICLLYYIQVPLTSTLQAINKAKTAMKGTLVGIILKTIVLIIASFSRIGLWGLVIANSINITYVTIHHLLVVRKELKD